MTSTYHVSWDFLVCGSSWTEGEIDRARTALWNGGLSVAYLKFATGQLPQVQCRQRLGKETLQFMQFYRNAATRWCMLGGALETAC